VKSTLLQVPIALFPRRRFGQFFLEIAHFEGELVDAVLADGPQPRLRIPGVSAERQRPLAHCRSFSFSSAPEMLTGMTYFAESST
jgi:hypothetical protein